MKYFDGLMPVYLDLTVIPPKRAAKSIVTEGRHFIEILEGLLDFKKKDQDKVRQRPKVHNINLFFLV